MHVKLQRPILSILREISNHQRCLAATNTPLPSENRCTLGWTDYVCVQGGRKDYLSASVLRCIATFRMVKHTQQMLKQYHRFPNTFIMYSSLSGLGHASHTKNPEELSNRHLNLQTKFLSMKDEFSGGSCSGL